MFVKTENNVVISYFCLQEMSFQFMEMLIKNIEKYQNGKNLLQILWNWSVTFQIVFVSSLCCKIADTYVSMQHATSYELFMGLGSQIFIFFLN